MYWRGLGKLEACAGISEALEQVVGKQNEQYVVTSGSIGCEMSLERKARSRATRDHRMPFEFLVPAYHYQRIDNSVRDIFSDILCPVALRVETLSAYSDYELSAHSISEC